MKKAKAKKTEPVANSTSKKGANEPREQVEQKEQADISNELAEAKAEIAKLQSEKQTLQEHSMRLQAEYDNYRRRTKSEKERIYSDALQTVCKELLVLFDNLARAKDSNEKQLAEEKDLDERALAILQSLVKGSDLLHQQAKQMLERLGVTEVAALGMKFNPDCHEAVMHIEDEQYGENEIIEVFQTGYQYGDRILRPAVVKVAN